MMFDKKEYQKEYREANKERLLQLTQEWRKENKDKIKIYNREYRKEYYPKNRIMLLEKYKKYRESNMEKVDNTQKEYRAKNRLKLQIRTAKFHDNNLATWYGYIPLQTQCQMCGQDIFFDNKDVKSTIRFDHRHGGTEPITTNPTNWLRNNKRTPENQKIWEVCNFGMLCINCNRSLPTKNRQQFVNNLNKYMVLDRILI